MQQIFVFAITVTMMFAGVADAGVRGGRFQGTIKAGANSHTVVSDFAQSGDGFKELFDANSFTGHYTELDLGVISIWNATYDIDPNYVASGFCLFSVVSTYSVKAVTGANFASGIVLKSGPAQ